MKLASIRAFRSGISSFTQKGQMVIVTKNGKMVGCFVPLSSTEDIPIELRREFIVTLGHHIATELKKQRTDEEEILNDFRDFKKNRRR